MCEKSVRITIPKDLEIDNENLKKQVNELMSCTSTVEQQKLIKNLPLYVDTAEDCTSVTKIICYIFLTIDPKHPIKKTVTRILLSMQEEQVTAAMAMQIICLIPDWDIEDKFLKLSQENEVLVNLNSCFNNFPPGIQALSRIIDIIFIFACNNYLKSVAYLYSESCDKHQVHTYIYNSSKFLVSLLNQCDISQHMSEISFQLLIACYKIICDEQIAFNTKSNCGILLIMAAIHRPEKDISQNKGGNSIESLLKVDGDGGFWRNSLLSRNHTAKICVIAGILNTVPHEITCSGKLDDMPAPIYIFQTFLDSASRRTGKPTEIVEISRTFMTLSRLLFHMDVEHINVIFKPTLDYVWTHMMHFIDTVRHDTISLLKNCVKIAVQYEKQGDKRLIDQIISYISDILEKSNTNFKIISIISGETTCSYLLKIFPDLPRKLANCLRNSSITQEVCNTYELLMEQNSKEDPSKWDKVWIREVAALIDDSDELLHSYIKKIFTTAFKLNQNIIKVLSQGNVKCDDPKQLSITLSCFISARKTNTPVMDVCHIPDVTEPVWNGMIKFSLLDVLMCHQNSEIRISTLTLIIECQKTTEIFPEWDLKYLVRYLRFNVTTQEPNVRQQLLALYRKAFTRYKESLYVIERSIKSLKNKQKALKKSDLQININLEGLKKQENYYKRFIEEIFHEELVLGLYHDVNYPRRSVCLDLMLYLRECLCREVYNKLWKKDYVEMLYQALDDSYESNIIMASKLLMQLPKNITYYQTKDELKVQLRNCFLLAESLKPTSTATAAYQLQIFKDSPHASKALGDLLKKEFNKDRSISLIYLDCIIEKIEKGLDIAKVNVLLASKHAPIYGLIFCIRHLIQKEKFDETFPEVVPKIIELCGRISEIASPIVNNSSPEGYMPMDNEIVADETVTSQMVLVYAWRTVKEVSLLLGELSIKNLTETEGESNKYLTQIANYFIQLFMETKHRGAYEQAYLGFTKFCGKLWHSGKSIYAEWPINWLNTILDVIKGKKDNFNKICSTRRSAGLPFMIQGILTTEPQQRSHESFHHCIKTLLKISEDLSEPNEKAATHSMNILRALYKHNQLGELVTPYVSKGVMIAIIGFSHPVWGVRNSATLMFSALMMRMFGVQRTKDNEELSIKNRLSARVFFMRYPELYDFILDKLKQYTSGPEGNVSLYPLLFILARLYPSGDKSEMLQYLPFINICLGGSICKMRELAAEASISAIPIEDYIEHITRLLNEISKKLPGNQLHGKLLQLYLLVKNLPNHKFDIDVPNLVKESFWLITYTGKTVSHMSTTIYFEILIMFITKFKEKCYANPIFLDLSDILLNKLKEGNSTDLSTSKSKFEITQLALYLELFVNIIEVPLINREKYFKDIILAALHSTNENIQIFGLNCLHYMFDIHFFKKYHIHPEDEEDEEKSELEYNLIKPLNTEMKIRMANAITADLGCYNLFTDLFHILKTRTKEYVVKVCLVLPYFPCIINRIRPKNIPVILDKQMILDFLVSECIRTHSDMFCALMPVLSTLVAEARQKMNYTHLINLVLKEFATADNSLDERMAVSNFFVHNPRFLYDKESLTTEDLVEVWYIVIGLLQDTDLVVRNRISKVTNYIQCPIAAFIKRFVMGIFVTSEKSLEELLLYMPLLIPYDEAMKIYLKLAFKLRRITKGTQEATDEVFDKGDLNVYEEGEPMATLATRCLKKCLWQLEDGLNYEDKSIFIEEHTLLAATKLFNLFYNNYTRSEDKLLSMLVLKEIIIYLEMRTINKGDFKSEFKKVLEKKFSSFCQTKMFNCNRVATFLKTFFTFEEY